MTTQQLEEEGYSVSDSFRGNQAKESAQEFAKSVRGRGFHARVKKDGDIYRVWFKRKT